MAWTAIPPRQFHSRTLFLSCRHCCNLISLRDLFRLEKKRSPKRRPASRVGLFIYRNGVQAPEASRVSLENRRCVFLWRTKWRPPSPHFPKILRQPVGPFVPGRRAVSQNARLIIDGEPWQPRERGKSSRSDNDTRRYVQLQCGASRVHV